MARVGWLLATAAGCAALAAGPSSARPVEASCTVGGLSVQRFLVSSPTGDLRTGLQFKSRGTTPCSLHGFPSLELRDRMGVIRFAFHDVGSAPHVEVRSGGSAFAIFSKFRCDLGNARTANTGRVWMPGRPNEQATFVMHVAVGLCERGIRAEARTVNVGPIEPTERAAYLSGV
jgi:hypothetical protein